MIKLLFVSLALAHGGEDHGAPPPTVASSDATTMSIAASSAEFEAVLRVKKGAAGTPVGATLLLDDYATSAPVSDATPSIALEGPASLEIPLAASVPGTYTGTVTFPVDGDYGGALVVTTPEKSDILALTGLRVAEAAPGPSIATGLKVFAVLGGVAILAVGGLVAAGIGYTVGRRRGAGAAVVVLAACLSARQVLAHGGEDHEPPAASPVQGEPASPERPGGSGGAVRPPQGSIASDGLHLAMESQFLVGLRTARLRPGSFQEQVPALGRFVARPGASATLRAPVAGELVAPSGGFPSPGSTVRVGQVLGIVRGAVGSADRAALAGSREQAATSVAEAKRAVALAERDAAQLSDLAGGLSEREILDRQQTLEVARTTLREAETALKAIGDGAGVIVRAPVAGRLGMALVRPGDQVQAGDALFRLVDSAGLWMEAHVPERLASGVTAGSTASVIATALPGVPLSAVILDAGQEADPATGTFTVTLAVDAAGRDLHPGMSATAWLGRGPERDTLVVPDDAVVDSNGMSIGFVKVGPEQFELRELKLGARSGGSWEVLAGLTGGERVVVDGTYTLRSLAGR